MRQRAAETHEHAKGRPVYYTEWSISSNPRDPFHDEPFAAALVTNILMSVDSLVTGYSYWTFTDVFEENYFPSVPFHGGFGLLNLYGIAKPAYRAFELLHRLGDELLVVEGSHKTVSAWTVRNKDGLTVLLTNHAMPRHAINTELARVTLSDASEPRSAYLQRIDEDHANARRVWRDIGEPEYLSESEVDQLRAASCLQSEPQPLRFKDQTIQFDIALPPHSVAAITIAL
jgi:xylan 1,4-beta-xylosidase